MATSHGWHLKEEQELARLAEGHIQRHGGEGRHDTGDTRPGRHSDIRSPGWRSSCTAFPTRQHQASDFFIS